MPALRGGGQPDGDAAAPSVAVGAGVDDVPVGVPESAGVVLDAPDGDGVGVVPDAGVLDDGDAPAGGSLLVVLVPGAAPAPDEDGVDDDAPEDGVVVAVDVPGDGVVMVDPAPAPLPAPDLVGLPASSPLASRSCWISSWTWPTSAATAAGEPPAPSCEIASSFWSSAVSLCSSSAGGSAVMVTTIWSAIAVVTQEGQLTLSASATLIGMMVLVWPTINTNWNDTATVVHALQLASAYALLTSSTVWPPLTVTSE
ncbi:MAG: hypothetical protein QOF86_2224 [Baekduia sp.]|nr:hypothetical protein [Baekduia sp.]